MHRLACFRDGVYLSYISWIFLSALSHKSISIFFSSATHIQGSPCSFPFLDIIFLIYLYQRWCYPVDPSRTHDDDDKTDSDSKDDKARGGAAECEETRLQQKQLREGSERGHIEGDEERKKTQ